MSSLLSQGRQEWETLESLSHLWEEWTGSKFSICCHEFILQASFESDQNLLAFLASPASYAEQLSQFNLLWSILAYLLVLRIHVLIINVWRGSAQLSSLSLSFSQRNLARYINELILHFFQLDLKYWSKDLKSCIVYGVNLRKLYLCFPQWSSPSEAIESLISKEILLAPPQFYEIRRLGNFASLSDLHKFSLDRESEGTERWMPIILLTADGKIHLLPGKSMFTNVLVDIPILCSGLYCSILPHRHMNYNLMFYMLQWS